MEKTLYSFTVRVHEDGDVIVIEASQSQEIFITPEAVPILKQWLDEAAAKILSNSTNSLPILSPKN